MINVNMLRRVLGIFIGLIIVSGTLFASSDYKIIKNLSLPQSQTYEGSILSWSGKIAVQGEFKGSIIMIGGKFELGGKIEEDVICVGSAVDIQNSALIKGDLYVIGGSLTRNPKSNVSGEYFNSQMDFRKIQGAILPILADTQTISFMKLIRLFLWLIIGLIVLALAPRKIIQAEEILSTHPLKVFIVGSFSFISILFLLLTFIFLSIFIIGIPLLFLLVLFYCAVYIFGRTILFYYIGHHTSRFLKLKQISSAIFILLGVVFYLILQFIPYVGPIVLFGLSLLEIGIGIGFIFRRKFKLEPEF